MKARIIKWYDTLLGSLLGLLGFTSCNILVNPFIRDMYGQPTASYKLVGSVTDEAGEPVKGIQVTFHPELGNNGEEVNSWIVDTLYSDASGKFSRDVLKYDWPDLDNAVVKFRDIDGPDNGGSFKPKDVPVSALKVDQTRKGEGNWNQGDFTITADATLEKE